MPPLTLPNATALSVQSVLDHIGINHHTDFSSEPALSLAITAVNFLGCKHIRDCADNPNCVGPSGSWQQFADGTGAKFCAFMTEGSPAAMTRDLPMTQQLIGQGIVELIEGGNENDNAYALSQGNSIAITKSFQSQVFAAGRALNIPVVNMSFGSGWTAANNWQGDYDKVGNMSAVCDYANSHCYPQEGGRATSVDVKRLRDLANIAAPGRQVIHTELGWKGSQFSNDFASIARWALFGLLDSIRDGNLRAYFYAIFDDGAGNFGFFSSDGSPRPAAVAIHNLTTILADAGPQRNDPLAYSLSGTMANDNVLLVEKSDGTFEFLIWNEIDAPHTVTVTLGAPAVGFKTYDPVTSSTGASLPGGVSASITVPNRPVILEVSAGVLPPPPPPTPTLVSVSLNPVALIGPAGSTGTVQLSDIAPSGGLAVALASDNGVADPGLTVMVPSGAASASFPVTTKAVLAATPATISGALNGVSRSAVLTVNQPAVLPPVALQGLAVVPHILTGGAGATGTVSLSGPAPTGGLTVALTSDNVAAAVGASVLVPEGATIASFPIATSAVSASVLATLSASLNGIAATTGLTVNPVTTLHPNPSWNLPASLVSGGTIPLAGISISDDWAINHAGSMALNLSTSKGALTALDATGAALPGSGSPAIHYSGSFAKVNAVLATLGLTLAGPGTYTITFDIWDQGGVEKTKTLTLTIT